MTWLQTRLSLDEPIVFGEERETLSLSLNLTHL